MSKKTPGSSQPSGPPQNRSKTSESQMISDFIYADPNEPDFFEGMKLKPKKGEQTEQTAGSSTVAVSDKSSDPAGTSNTAATNPANTSGDASQSGASETAHNEEGQQQQH